MNPIDHAFIALLRPFGGTEGLAHTSRLSVLACVIGLLILAFVFRRNGNKLKCLDMDGVPMKELGISSTSKTAMLFQPPLISKHGEKLAHDEPYIIRSGKHREVVLHTAEHVREFLRNDAKADRLLGQCVGALNGKKWRVVRSYFDPAYSHNASLVILPSFQNEVVKWLNTLKNDSLRTGVGRLVVHAPTSCKILPLRVIPQSFYGEAYDDDAYTKLVRVSQIQGQALKYAVTGRWQKYRWFNMLPTPSRRQLDRYHQDWQAFNLEMLETARKKGLAIPAENVFKGVQPDDAMSMDQYLQTIDEMIFTNIDITASVLAFMLSKLTKHPDFQQKLYEEIVAQKAEEGFNLNNYITRQTTLLHYLCLESVRLRPATWFSVPECTTIDKVIGRYKIPAQTPIIIDVRRLNTNALTWGPDGAEFRPERFASLSPNEYRYGYMRFGVVSGKCLGKHMAVVLMKVAIITVLERYKIEEVEMNIGVKDGDLAFIKRK
ncbi:Cytochrome P450 [Tolypocladium ophioglossoides CBS 100239]|uniref:Cytochrome P450 n=1 Tax=Tolypocladium ophioglossoides (strain CBS 100239) TaxID=1163406 RepID=A0A0L0MZB6_TOLOC|nr:Cytochrome P450 [Tolypocladium ophioglossoides CBS 100239]